MKKRLTAGFIFVVVLVFIGSIYYVEKTPNSQLSISSSIVDANNQVMFPTENDILRAGQIYDITWFEDPNVSQVQINLMNKDTGDIDKNYNIPNTGHYSYTVPTGIKTGLYRFEIGDLKSDYFEIVNPKM